MDGIANLSGTWRGMYHAEYFEQYLNTNATGEAEVPGRVFRKSLSGRFMDFLAACIPHLGAYSTPSADLTFKIPFYFDWRLTKDASGLTVSPADGMLMPPEGGQWYIYLNMKHESSPREPGYVSFITAHPWTESKASYRIMLMPLPPATAP